MLKIGRMGYLFFSVFLIILDQFSKIWVIKNIDVYQIKYSFFGDFLRIIHVRNKGVLFSAGDSMPDLFRITAFIIFPIIILGIILKSILFDKTMNKIQSICLSAILAGGIGNVIDRIFRKDGVVDFVDVKFYGIFGMQRWPTFNLADAYTTVFGVILIITLLIKNNRRN